MTEQADIAEIRRALEVLIAPGQVTELRALKVSGEPGGWRAPHTVSGYFNLPGPLASAAAALSGKAKGVYITPNPASPDLLARAANRARALGPGDPTTADNDIAGRRWLLLDFDPTRPSGISSSEAEHALALAHAQAVRDWLASAGWPAGVLADSGNGAHLLYRVDLPTDDGGLLKRVLEALAAQFDTAAVKADRTVYNPARIWKLYGTLACKGDSTPDRPHRLGRLLDVPDALAPVPLAMLEALAGQAPQAKPAAAKPAGKADRHNIKQTPARTFDIDAWISEYGLEVGDPEPWQGGWRWIFNVCPFNADHTDASAVLLQMPGGALAFRCQHNGCSGKDWAELRELYEPGSKAKREAWGNGPTPSAGRAQPAQAEGDAPGRPQIVSNRRQLREVVADALAALDAANNPPALFVRSGALVRVKIDEKGRPTIEAVTEHILRERLGKAADWYTENVFEGGPNFTPCYPSLEVAREVMAAPAWPFPGIDSIIECPALRPDGTVITAAGYDAATGLYYHPTPGLVVGDIPHQPTPEQQRAALSLIREAIGDFPYENLASEANALAAYLTPILRPAIGGRVPLALIDAPNAGTGKSLLAAAIWRTATGHGAAMMTAPKDSDEWRKRITAALATGSPIVIVDNLAGMLFAGELAAALTTPVWSDRILGQSKMIALPSNAVWLATGNNIRLGGDIPRRCFWIRLDAKLSRPWQRGGFQHADLEGWIVANRGRLIAAGLTLARAWWAAGCPKADAPSIGGFSEWARALGGVLASAGVPGFLGNLEAMYETADDDGPQWEAFLLALHEKHKCEPVTVSQICKALADDEALREVAPENLGDVLAGDGRVKPDLGRRLGRAFQYRQGTRYGDAQARIERLGKDAHAKAVTWRLNCSRPACDFCGYAGIAGIVSPQVSAEKVNSTPGGGAAAAGMIPAIPAIPAKSGPADLLAGEL